VRPHPALAPSLVGLLFFTLLALRVGSTDGFRYLRPIQAGELLSRPAVLLPGQVPIRGVGYDGQFYFYIAQDPFLRKPETAPSLDNSLRYRRILYPFLAWLLSLGQRQLLPFVLVALNVLAATAVVTISALAAIRAGRSPWLALAVGLFPGLWIPIMLDLTEPLQLALLAAGMLAGSSGLLLLSCLAKETSAVALLTEGARHLLARRWRPAGRQAFALAVLAGWSLFVWRTVRAHESTLGGHLLDPPGAPFLLLARDLVPQPARAMFLLVAVLICLLALVRLAWARDGGAWAGAAYALVGLAAGSDTWSDPTAYFRVIAGAVVLVFPSWCLARDRAGTILLALGVVAGLATAIVVLVF